MMRRSPRYPWSFSQDQSPYCRNVTANHRRTSIRMEPMVWQSLAEIAEAEGMTINDICTEIDLRRGPMGLTAAIRLFVLHYFRLALADVRNPDARTPILTVDQSVPPGFSDPGTTELVPGPATVDGALAIFAWTEESLARIGQDQPVR